MSTGRFEDRELDLSAVRSSAVQLGLVVGIGGPLFAVAAVTIVVTRSPVGLLGPLFVGVPIPTALRSVISGVEIVDDVLVVRRPLLRDNHVQLCGAHVLMSNAIAVKVRDGSGHEAIFYPYVEHLNVLLQALQRRGDVHLDLDRSNRMAFGLT